MSKHFPQSAEAGFLCLLIIVIFHQSAIPASWAQESQNPNNKFWEETDHIRRGSTWATLERAARLSQNGRDVSTQITNGVISIRLDTPLEAARWLSEQAFQQVSAGGGESVLKGVLATVVDVRTLPVVRREAVRLMKPENRANTEQLLDRIPQRPNRPEARYPEPPSPRTQPPSASQPRSPPIQIPSIFGSLSGNATGCSR